MKERRKQTLKI